MLLLTHNAYWFQGEPSLWGQEETRRHPRAMAALTRLYRELAPEVICLQEVPRAQVVDDLAESLGMEGVFAAGGRRPGYGGAVLWKGSASAVEDLTRAPPCGDDVFERICMRYTAELERGDRDHRQSAPGLRSLFPGWAGGDGVVLSDHHPVWAELRPAKQGPGKEKAP